jgi:hypothetical protein
MTASYDKLSSTLTVRTYADDPADATVVRQIAWVPMGQSFLALATLISGTGILTFKIYAAVDSSGTTPTLVKAHADPTVADAANDQVFLEVSAEEVRQALSTAKYVSVQMDNDTNTDINAVTYVIRGALVGGRFAYAGMTADVIA